MNSILYNSKGKPEYGIAFRIVCSKYVTNWTIQKAFMDLVLPFDLYNLKYILKVRYRLQISIKKKRTKNKF